MKYFRPAQPFFQQHYRQSILCVLLCLFLVGCSKESSSPTGGDTAIESDTYVQATIDGTVRTFQVKAGDPNTYGHGRRGSKGTETEKGHVVIERAYFQKAIVRNGKVAMDSLHSIHFSFVKFFPTEPYGDETGYTIPTGNVPFGVEQEPEENEQRKKYYEEGVIIEWVDGNGKRWSSEGAQDGSVFTVSSHKKTGKSRPYGKYQTKGTFSCWLYDGKGGAIRATNGKFSMETIIF